MKKLIEIQLVQTNRNRVEQAKKKLENLGIKSEIYITKNFGTWYHLKTNVIKVKKEILPDIRTALNPHCSFTWEHKEKRVLKFSYSV